MENCSQHSGRLAELSADNRVRCFSELRRSGDRTLAELAAATGLSRPTIKGHLDSLVMTGLVREGERGSTKRGGRPAVTFSVNPDGAYLAVFDVSKHEHRFLLVDLSGVIRASLVNEVDGNLAMTERAELIDEGLRELTSSAGISFDSVTCFSGSVGAQVDSGGAIVRNIGDVALLDADFAVRFRAPVIVENDLKAACYAEQSIGCAQGVSDVVYALAWHQVAAGIVLDGRIRRGFHELAGELNRAATTGALPPDQAERWRSWPAFMAVIGDAEQGDQAAVAEVERFCAKAAHQIALLAMSVDPEMIVLGGPLVHRSNYFVSAFRSRLAFELNDAPPIAIELSALRSWAPALGATLRGLEALETQLVGAPTFEYALRNATAVPLPLPSPSETRTLRAS